MCHAPGEKTAQTILKREIVTSTHAVFRCGGRVAAKAVITPIAQKPDDDSRVL
jgi:hypothetical protein